MAEPVPNRAKSPRRSELVHFYSGMSDRYSHSAYVRRNSDGSFHSGDIEQNTAGLSKDGRYSYRTDEDARNYGEAPENVSMTRPKRGKK